MLMVILYRLSPQHSNIKLKMIHKAHSGSHEDSIHLVTNNIVPKKIVIVFPLLHAGVRR